MLNRTEVTTSRVPALKAVKTIRPYIFSDLQRFFHLHGIKYEFVGCYLVTKTHKKFPALAFRYDKVENYTWVNAIPVNGTTVGFHVTNAKQLLQKLSRFNFLQLPGGRLYYFEDRKRF